MVFGIRPGDLLALVREAQRGLSGLERIVVSGAGAVEVAEALAAGGERSSVVVAGDPATASAVVRIVGSPPTPEDAAVLRAGARAGAHLVALRRSEDAAPLPYVPATDVVDWPEGAPAPTTEIARSLAHGLGEDVAGLASTLPVLRKPAARRTIVQTSVGAAGLVAMAGRSAVMLPVLSLLQARMLRRLQLAQGVTPPAGPQGAALTVGVDLAAALATGLVCRGVVRRAPGGGRLLRSAVAAAGTAGLGVAARHLPRPPAP